ncbi:MAG: hypothetical protein PSW75_06740 [bacterium]|nr:hypothetical protein [bacterium]MDI1337136.1 hypothetical protein [Lacunisphaera sp.]
MPETLSMLLAPAVALLLLLFYINLRVASPILAIPIRWMRWILFALFAAETNDQLALVDRPFWVVTFTVFLLWFLLESGFNWLKVSAISLSPLPLFPRYVVNSGGDEWPTQQRLLKVRDWLRDHRFTPVQALKAEIGGGIWLRTSVYHSHDNLMRLHVLFVPQENGAITVCYSLATLTTGTRRYVTDNLYIPFGGFYPESWHVDRSPWRRNLARLVVHHRGRLEKSGETPLTWEISPIDDINQQQQHMEMINTELGYLLPHADREEYGKITPEGRFRIWKEAWLLNYFGIAGRYS